MAEYSEFELELTRRLARVEAGFLRRLVDALGMPPSGANVPQALWNEYRDELNRVLTTTLQNSLLGELQRFIEAHPELGINWDGAVLDSNRWSMEYITGLAQEITDNSVRITGELAQDAAESGLTAEDLMERLAWRFGPAHAELVAVTEITRANAQAARILQGRLSEMGVETIRRFLTAEDEKVCEICGPLDHVAEDEDGTFEGFGDPPLHPKCRCQVVVERRP